MSHYANNAMKQDREEKQNANQETKSKSPKAKNNSKNRLGTPNPWFRQNLWASISQEDRQTVFAQKCRHKKNTFFDIRLVFEEVVCLGCFKSHVAPDKTAVLWNGPAFLQLQPLLRKTAFFSMGVQVQTVSVFEQNSYN